MDAYVLVDCCFEGIGWCSRGECFDLGFGVDDTFVVFVYLFWLQGGVMVGSNVTEAICVDVLFVVLVVMVWLNVVVGLGCGVRSVLVMVMDHVVVVGVLSNKRCRGCGVDVPMLCWGLVGAWANSSEFASLTHLKRWPGPEDVSQRKNLLPGFCLVLEVRTMRAAMAMPGDPLNRLHGLDRLKQVLILRGKGTNHTPPAMEARKPIVCGHSARGILPPPLPQEDTNDDVADVTPSEVEVVEISNEEEAEWLLQRIHEEEKKLKKEKFKAMKSGIKLEEGQSSKVDEDIVTDAYSQVTRESCLGVIVSRMLCQVTRLM
ncbi:hypothetical protein F2Q70_00010122 [Brassica cretica]|uniref:Uncharacterized protein n=1 Tax=Brassica cretica TaxID=69181 RepID=A0A8S9LZC9_BRACR|nr:hypothetical protein F2Q70_00010122 [Brassica cretica]